MAVAIDKLVEPKSYARSIVTSLTFTPMWGYFIERSRDKWVAEYRIQPAAHMAPEKPEPVELLKQALGLTGRPTYP